MHSFFRELIASVSLIDCYNVHVHVVRHQIRESGFIFIDLLIVIMIQYLHKSNVPHTNNVHACMCILIEGQE